MRRSHVSDIGSILSDSDDGDGDPISDEVSDARDQGEERDTRNASDRPGGSGRGSVDEEDDIGMGKHFRLFRALARRPDDRMQRDLEEIFEAIQTISDPFIIKLEETVKRAICKRLTIEEFANGEKIFDYGDDGDKLYMIWNGRVLIEVPRHFAATQDNASKNSRKPLELMKLGCFDPGKVFGELALISSDSRRNARITTVKPTTLFVLHKEDYMWCVGFSQQNFILERVSFLRSLDRAVLEGVKEVDLQAMAGHLQEERFTGGATVLHQGAEVDRVIFVKSGFCKVIRNLHPKHKETFELYAEYSSPPPNPFADVEESTVQPNKTGSSRKRGKSRASAHDEELQLDSREALKDLLRRYNALDTITTRNNQGARSVAGASDVATSPSEANHGSSGRGRPLVSEKARTAAADQLETDVVDKSEATEVVVVDLLQQGRSFGIMEMMEGLTYQCSVVSDPWAEVYVVTKYDLIRNTAKTILHKLFCDYKARLGDDRLLQRLKQKNRWNNYKRELLEEIQNRKRAAQSSTIDRREGPRRTGAGDLSIEDCRRVGKGEKLWDIRASTPPRLAYASTSGAQVQHIFRVQCQRNDDGVPDVHVEREIRDASMAALDEKILMTIATARFRDKFRREKVPNKLDKFTASLAGGNDGIVDSSPHKDVTVSDNSVRGSSSRDTKDTVRPLRTQRSRRPPADLHPVIQAQELEEKARQAAGEYLEERSGRIERIREHAKEKISASPVPMRPSRTTKVASDSQGGRMKGRKSHAGKTRITTNLSNVDFKKSVALPSLP